MEKNKCLNFSNKNFLQNAFDYETWSIFCDVVFLHFFSSAESVEIEDITLKPGSKKGDGFACDIAAIQVQFHHQP